MNHTPTSHAAQAGIDLDSLTRYDYVPGEAGRMIIGQDDNGAYVLRADVESLIARKAAQAAPAADERALFEAWSNRVAPAHGFDVDERGQYVEYPVHTGWAAWQARAALAQQSASSAPAAQAVDAHSVADDPKFQELVNALLNEYWNPEPHRAALAAYVAALAASPAPETAQADDVGDDEVAIPADMTEVEYWRRRAKAAQAIARGFKRRFEAATAHAQQDAAPIAKMLASQKPLPAEFTAVLEKEAWNLYDTAPSAATGKAAAAKDAEQWTKTPPTEQADYWHWNDDPDHAPMIYHVMWSGTAKKCFVSMGQYDIDEAIWCDNFGGWWLKIEQPSIPSDRAAIAASQKGGAHE